MAHDNTNRGAIWKNRDKKEDKHPDFKGSLNVNGVEFWVSAWKRKESDPNNRPALSFTIKPKDEKASASAPTPSRHHVIEDDDEIPF